MMGQLKYLWAIYGSFSMFFEMSTFLGFVAEVALWQTSLTQIECDGGYCEPRCTDTCEDLSLILTIGWCCVSFVYFYDLVYCPVRYIYHQCCCDEHNPIYNVFTEPLKLSCSEEYWERVCEDSAYRKSKFYHDLYLSIIPFVLEVWYILIWPTRTMTIVAFVMSSISSINTLVEHCRSKDK